MTGNLLFAAEAQTLTSDQFARRNLTPFERAEIVLRSSRCSQDHTRKPATVGIGG